MVEFESNFYSFAVQLRIPDLHFQFAHRNNMRSIEATCKWISFGPMQILLLPSMRKSIKINKELECYKTVL